MPCCWSTRPDGTSRSGWPFLRTSPSEAGLQTADLCRKHGISPATFYQWKAKFGGLEVSEARRLRTLEAENARLKKLLAEAMLDNAVLKDVASKKW
jgi:putative transposase